MRLEKEKRGRNNVEREDRMKMKIESNIEIVANTSNI